MNQINNNINNDRVVRSVVETELELTPTAEATVMAKYQNTADVIHQLQPDEPHYLLSPERLKQRAELFLENFPGEVSFAVKSNPNPMVIKTLFDAGVRAFDVASYNEITQIHEICPEATLHFNNPIKWKQSIIESFHDYGVRSFVVDDIVGLQQILKHCSAINPLAENTLEIAVRFTLPKGEAAYDFGSKFGASPAAAVEILKAVKAAKQLCSITFHPGSQCTDPKSYVSYIEMADKIATEAQVDIVKLNVGGGFPVAYDNYQIAALQHYFDQIETAFAKTKFVEQATPTTLLCEPGRAMVADSVSLLAQVIHKREDGTIFLNDGIYGSFQEQLIVKLVYPITCWRGAERLEEQVAATAVFGPTCDPTDQLGEMMLPLSLAEGDWVEFGLMGAYSGVTATHFNGYVIPEYLLVEE